MKRLFFGVILILSTTLIFSQKKAITHDDYDLWKNIENVDVSDDGLLVVTTIETTTGRGDGYLTIYNTKTKKEYRFENGYDPSISSGSNYVVFKRKPDYSTIRKEKKKKTKKDNQSKDALFIYSVKQNKIMDSVLNIKKYSLPKEYEGWVIIERLKEKGKKQKVDSLKKKNNKLQNYMLVYDLSAKKSDTVFQIKDFIVPKRGGKFFYTRKNVKNKGYDTGIYEYNLGTGKKTTIDDSKYIYDKLATDDDGTQLSYLSVSDSTATDSLKYQLQYYNSKLVTLIDSTGKNLRDGWILSKDHAPSFSKNGNRLYFNSLPKVVYEKDTTLLDDEIPQVDVWNWKDQMIQPEQKSRLKELKRKAYVSYYDVNTRRFVQLQDTEIDNLIFDNDREQQFILGTNRSPYEIERSWSFPWRSDYYVIDSNTGKKQIAIEGAGQRPILSPDGKFAVYYSYAKRHWFSLNLETRKKKNLTEGLPVAFYDEDDDHPSAPGSYGYGGFDKEGHVLIYDKFDVWRFSLNGVNPATNITRTGRENTVEYRTLRLDPENRKMASYMNDQLILRSFNHKTRVSGLYTLDKSKLVTRIQPSNYLINGYRKSKNSDTYVYTKQNFKVYPDVYVSTKNKLSKATKITNVNPQQKNFKWGTAELFSWNAYDGKKLEGIIYKPENFDPNKKYPLITYFYEKSSDRLHSYRSPQPSASTVNPTYLVSNDYVMFVPDIVYEDGKPGPSAYNCIVSGVEALEKLGYIDSENMAIQGQSWGGYQVAYLITVTNKFKAAMAGAPVSNMTSAYGGIRWQSGLSRAFQYERTQTRIGKNLWEGFDLYIENSPLFGIPKIETPLLMMHNDNDGAVPYYQGIEMFMGMRRLEKPVWLLVYNNEAHNLRKVKNKQDLSIRMMQFFDHYLKATPAPKWMTQGLPRTQKGKDFGYELDKD